VAIRLLCCSGSLEGGGSERQLWQLATNLDSARFTPEIYLLYRRGIYLSRLPARIPVHAFWSDFSENQFFFPGQIHAKQGRHLAQLIRERGIDVVYDRTFHMTLITAAACRQTGTPRLSVIVSPPSLDFKRSRERFKWIKRRLLSKAYRDPLCSVLAVSQSVAEDAMQFYGLPRAKIQTVASPIDVEAVQQAAKMEVGQLAAADQPWDLNLVVVGRLSAEKGQRLAIEALAVLRQQRPNLNVVLDIVGDGPDRELLERLAKTLGVEGQVRFLGFLENPYPLIRRAGLVLIPSVYEGLPNVALEAMGLGTPVLATESSGSLRELLGDRERGVLVPVGDTAALVREILNRVEQPADWEQRASLASHWVPEHHGLQPWCARMQQLLECRARSAKSDNC
jgi:glycosyltransferase involved in cell wall biosynthesis